ncbi:MAG: DUF4340 domain-containing protein [Spirochaetaceae bacterium]|jgi:hypothetical protein|nr:DUF4340 domain-containing protein [Spirochaetaceae bacterium]
MKFKTKVLTLGCIAAALAIGIIISFVFDPQRVSTRSSYYQWSTDDALSAATEIVIHQADGSDISLERAGKDAPWTTTVNSISYPVLQTRVSDMLSAISARKEYPLRAGNAASFNSLGLADSAAKKISVKDSTGALIIELLVGNTDSQGDVYLALGGDGAGSKKEARSGKDTFTTYLSGGAKSWYDLRLFPDHDANDLTAASVLSITIDKPATTGDAPSAAESYTLSRAGNGWQLSPAVEGRSVETTAVDTLLTSILDATASDFVTDAAGTGSTSGGGSVKIVADNGLSYTIQIGAKAEEGASSQNVSITSSPAGGKFASSFVYSLGDWSVNQMLKTKDSLLAAPTTDDSAASGDATSESTTT